MGHKHEVKIEKNAGGKYEIKVYSINGNFIIGSRQGYENKADAEQSFLNFRQSIKEDLVKMEVGFTQKGTF